ncbi:MAG: DUF3850 domain-containing protein [Candidatus Electrothrix sp. LOE2]|nr:DUF3850 domain-containing protein [Candidatus Electrothrix sp. LOE2]
MTTTHELKILPEYFEVADSMLKPFEIRENDRDYTVGDFVVLKECFFDGDKCVFTGRQTSPRIITYIFDGGGWLCGDVVVLGLQKMDS